METLESRCFSFLSNRSFNPMKQNWLLQFIQPYRQWIPYVVLVGTLGLTAWVTGYIEDTAQDKDKIRFQNAIQRTENSIENQLKTYVAMLQGGSGLFSASDAVDREEFRTYVNRLLLKDHYPGVQGIGFSRRYPASERQEIAAALSVEGIRNFTLYPTYDRSVYYPIVYLEPLDQRNRKALGYDMFTEPARRAAMAQARDEGRPVASGKVTLVQEIDEEKQAGFLIYVPVYEGGNIPGTVTERRTRLKGFVYSPFRVDDLMDGIFGAEPYPFVNFQIYDGTTMAPESLLYSSRSEQREARDYQPRFTTTLPVSVAGRRWTIVYTTKPSFDDTSSIGLVPFVAIGGTLVSLLLFSITRSQVKARTEAEQAAFRLRQSESDLQRSHEELEHRVEERTAELARANSILQAEITARRQIQEALERAEQSLKQSLSFADLLQRITERVRDSLDETQILQTAVEALAVGLDVAGCNTGLYDLERGVSRIAAEATTRQSPRLRRTVQMEAFSEGYEALLAGQNLQFCLIQVPSPRDNVSVLVCPVFDDQGVLGDLWLFRPSAQVFTAFEVRLVEQVATQCAIALRQARLYEAAQAQVKALEKVNWLKDDFLSTVSHELRTPVSNMKMAIRMLELTFNQMNAPSNGDRKKFQQYLQILQSECQREIDLINDLLDLQRLVSGKQTADVQTVNIPTWLSQLVEPFQERAGVRQQTLRIDLPSKDLPPLVADISSLERILGELLNNACKYTPPNEVIVIRVQSQSGRIQFSVCNSGVEIPEDELPRIFDKFYRIPNADPWKQGGTGLGLALAQRLAENMGGQIHVGSAQGTTTFTVVIPNQVVRDRIQEPV